MSVELDPADLSFKRPFTKEVTKTLRLKNHNRDPVAFKVKTTAPKQYCVRPNSGRIEAGKDVEVQVLLQAMKEDPPLDAKCRDKFLVQSVAVSADKEFSTVAQIWQHVEQTSKHLVQERKIRVVFLPADNSASTPQHISNGVADVDTPGHDNTTYGTPSRSVPVGPVSRGESRPIDAPHTGDARSSASNPAASNMSSAAASMVSAVPTSTDELKAQISQAKDKAANLTTSASDGLRQRKGQSDGRGQDVVGAATTEIQPQVTEGVPVQVVAALCLLSFLLAYLFF